MSVEMLGGTDSQSNEAMETNTATLVGNGAVVPTPNEDEEILSSAAKLSHSAQSETGATLNDEELISVLIVDDHALAREGTKQILERHEGFVVIGEADRGDLAVEMAEQLKPDVVLLDIFLPGMNGVEAARLIAERAPGVKILALSAFGDKDYVDAMLDAGVAGYLLKTARPDKLVDAVRAVCSGNVVVDVAVSQRPDLQGSSRHYSPVDLTSRELEVVKLVAQGRSNQQIALQLNISRRTVESHLHHIFDKLGVTSRTEVLLYAVEHHLVVLGDGGVDRVWGLD
ncbi:MAG: response regulator transcription factor [Actinobacteria bacterium]|jgi:DNA-binding NarL/FixJ family response regulator|nr:response regulator transcription factor [Actinomycetota bacterium]MCL6095605.1 response regulator transcription factor [Actinomycetota bacterium]